MRAELHRIHSPDVHDLGVWSPKRPDFGILLQLFVGPEGGIGEESFDVTVCSVCWLAERLDRAGVFEGRHHLFVARYDFAELEQYLRERLSTCHGETWEEVAIQLSRFGAWEFEDYRP